MASEGPLLAGKNKKNKREKVTVETYDVSALGEYSSTSPYQCPKTDKIITRLADRLVANPKSFGGATNSGVLGLLATGEERYVAIAFVLLH